MLGVTRSHRVDSHSSLDGAYAMTRSVDIRSMRRRPLLDRARRSRIVVVLGLALAVSSGAVEPDGGSSAPPLGPSTVSSERLHMFMTIGTHRFNLAIEDN